MFVIKGIFTVLAMLFLADPLATFDATSLSLPMETYFSTSDHQSSIKIYVVAPPKEGIQEERLTKENVYPILNDFYKLNSNHIHIKFIYYRAISVEDYQRTNIEQFERSAYMHLNESQELWNTVEWVGELKMEIK